MPSPRVATIALLTLALVATGCSRGSQSASLAHVLRIAIPSDPSSLSPLVAFAQNDIADDLLFAQTLIGLDSAGHLVPVLVTRVPSRENGDVSTDGLRLTYHLRRGVRFADGVPLSSDDVRFTYRALLDPRNRAAGEASYERIARVETPDSHTAVIVLKARWNAAVSELFAESDFAIGILPAHAFSSTQVVGTAWDGHAFGTGPFRVIAWRRGDRIVLEPNPYFTPRAKLRRLEIRFIPAFASALVALRAGDVDVAQVGTPEAQEVRGISGLALHTDPLNGNFALTLQTQLAPTDDLHVRRGISYALDYAALAAAWHGIFPTITSYFGPTVVTWRTAPLTPPFVHDPLRAAREFDAAGWHLSGGVRSKAGMPINLTLMADAGSSDQTRGAVLVQRDLAALGVPLTIKVYPESVLSAVDGPERNGRFSLGFTGQIGGSDAEPSVYTTCEEAKPGGTNYGRFCSREADAAFADQVTTADPARRRADFARIERIVREQIPLIPLHQFTTLWGVANRVGASYRRDPLDFPLHAETWDTR